MSPSRPYDLLLWGATGFTGQCAAEYLARYYPLSKGVVRWAIGGRNLSKLEKLKQELVLIDPSCKDIEILIADVKRQEEVDRVIEKTKVVLSTAGPFAEFGTPIVDACVRFGTHYCDITGESYWVLKLVKAYHEEAKNKGVFLVPFCGFDSIPSDIGALMMVDYIRKSLGTDCQQVEYFLTGVKTPGMAGGTMRSAFGMLERPWNEVKESMNPYCLNPADSPKPKVSSDFVLAKYHPSLEKWYGLFFMASVNTKVVRRSAALNNYHPTFIYNEYMASRTYLQTFLTTIILSFGFFLLQFAFIRRFFGSMLPEPGQGPSKKSLEGCGFKGVYVAKTVPKPNEKPQVVFGRLKSEGDAGYRETAKMICESAICLATQMDEIKAQGKQGGVLTPASSMGTLLLERLRNARMIFEVGPNVDPKS